MSGNALKALGIVTGTAGYRYDRSKSPIVGTPSRAMERSISSSISSSMRIIAASPPRRQCIALHATKTNEVCAYC